MHWAKSFVPEIKIVAAEVLGSTLGLDNTWGAVDGRTAAGPLTFARINTDDREVATSMQDSYDETMRLLRLMGLM